MLSEEPQPSSTSLTDCYSQWLDGQTIYRTSVRSAYVHIPFCHHRCGYCNFSVIAGRNDFVDAYLEALERELSVLGEPCPVETLYIGGGTPSMLDARGTERLTSILERWLPLVSAGEWTIEANPCDITPELCSQWASTGINRVSLGLQSFHDEKLASLDRTHRGWQSDRAIEICQASFPNISIDLIFGAPGESLANWHDDVMHAARTGVQHVSTYGLTIEKGTRFWALEKKSEISKPPETIEADMYELAIDMLGQCGFEHYEVSNFSKPGFRSRHNSAYWQGASWWAFGSGASRTLGLVRSTNHASPTTYVHRLQQDRSPVVFVEKMTRYEATIDAFVFGMRQREGVPMSQLQAQGDALAVQKITEEIEAATRQGWFQANDERVWLTRRGLMISDSIWPRFYN